MKIEKISDIYEVLKGYTRKKRLVVAFANDSHSIEAVYMAVKAGLVEGILVGIRRLSKECVKKTVMMNRVLKLSMNRMMSGELKRLSK